MPRVARERIDAHPSTSRTRDGSLPPRSSSSGTTSASSRQRNSACSLGTPGPLQGSGRGAVDVLSDATTNGIRTNGIQNSRRAAADGGRWPSPSVSLPCFPSGMAASVIGSIRGPAAEGAGAMRFLLVSSNASSCSASLASLLATRTRSFLSMEYERFGFRVEGSAPSMSSSSSSSLFRSDDEDSDDDLWCGSRILAMAACTCEGVNLNVSFNSDNTLAFDAFYDKTT